MERCHHGPSQSPRRMQIQVRCDAGALAAGPGLETDSERPLGKAACDPPLYRERCVEGAISLVDAEMPLAGFGRHPTASRDAQSDRSKAPRLRRGRHPGAPRASWSSTGDIATNPRAPAHRVRCARLLIVGCRGSRSRVHAHAPAPNHT